MADHDRKKSKGERAAEREAAKQLLLETNIRRVFSILAGFNLKQPLGEKKERLEKNLKQLKSMVDTERAAFGVLGPKRTPEEIKEEIARCTEKLRAVREQYEKIERGVDTICAEDINAMFDKLGYDGPEDPSRRVGYSRAVEIDRMIFECDENMQGRLTLQEVMRAYYRAVNDKTLLEPFGLFNLVQFLMYDEDLGGSCSMDEVVALMYSRYEREEAEEHVKEMREADDGDGELSFAEYLSCVEKRPPLALLRKRGAGMAASKSIHIDWLAIMDAKKEAQKKKHEHG